MILVKGLGETLNDSQEKRQEKNMLERMARRITMISIDHKVIAAEDEDIYIYGWSLMLSTLASTLMMILIGALAAEFFGSLLYILFFVSLRVLAGGYHANTYLKCFMWTLFFYLVALAVCAYLPVAWTTGTIIVLISLSVVITFIFAPADHPNKPLSDKRKALFRKKSRLLVSMQALLLGVILYFAPVWTQHYLLWAAVGLAMTSLTLFFVQVFKPYERAEKKKEEKLDEA
jgi:accessory gene regulator B